jgi:type I restriction enzyme S subunit
MSYDGWTQLRFGDVCTKIGSGATPRGGGEVYLTRGTYALIRSQNIHNDGFHRDGLAFIGDEHAAELDNVEVRSADVLLNITGDSVARCCMVDDSVLPARVNQHVTIVRPDPKKLDPYFLRYFLISPSMQGKMLSWAGSGGTRNALTKAMIESFEVRAPKDVKEQSAIGTVLRTLDDRTVLNCQMNETLEGMARALFKSWFVDFDPVRAKAEARDTGLPTRIADLFPDSFEDSEVGEIPTGWQARQLGDVCERIFSGGTPSTTVRDYWGGKLPWLSSGETRAKFITSTEKSITEKGVQNSSTRLARAGATVVASAGQGNTRGQTSMLMLDTYINQSVVALLADKAKTTDHYLFFDLARRYEEFRRVSDGHSSRGSLTTKLLAGLTTVLPQRHVVLAFDSVVAPLIQRIAASLHETNLLSGLRDTLLPKLISGELRVRDAERIVGVHV